MAGPTWSLRAGLVALALAAGACQSPPAPVASGGSEGTTSVRRTVRPITITGVVYALPGYRGGAVVSNNGGGLIGNNGASIISDAGASLIGKAKLLQADAAASERQPLAGAQVTVLFEDGRAVPGLASATTDAAGRFKVAGVPAGFVVVVAAGLSRADGKAGLLATLVRTGASDKDVQIGAASTMATLAQVRLGGGAAGSLGGLDVPAFLAKVEILEAKLAGRTLPDFTEPAEVLAGFEAIAATQPEVALRSPPPPPPGDGASELICAVGQLGGGASPCPPAAAGSPSPATGGPGATSPAPGSPTPAPTPGGPTPAPSSTPEGVASASPTPGPSPTGSPSSPPASASPAPATPTPAPATPTPPAQPFTGEVTTIAGSTTSGSTDGPGATARFNVLGGGGAVAADGKLYVLDTGAGRIRVVDLNTPDYQVSTLTGLTPPLSSPTRLGADAAGGLFVADGSMLKQVDPASRVVTDVAALPASVSAFTFGGGGTWFALRFGDHAIYQGTTVAVGATTGGFADGASSDARFNAPQDVLNGGDGKLYIADQGNQRIRVVDVATLSAQTLAGTSVGLQDGPGGSARFSSPLGVAVRGGHVLVADSGNNAIRGIGPDQVVYTLAGGSSGTADGSGAAAQFSNMRGLAAGPSGALYVIESRRIRRLQ